MQPITRIVLADALERWAASLESTAPLFTVETAYELADRIVNPRPPKKEEPEVQPKDDSGLSRTGADPNELEFAFEEGASNPATPASSQGEVKRRILGMTLPQLALLGGMILVEVCVLIGLAVFIFLNTNLL